MGREISMQVNSTIPEVSISRSIFIEFQRFYIQEYILENRCIIIALKILAII